MKGVNTETHYVNSKSNIPEKMDSLPKWFTELHSSYNLSAWCFYGYVGSGSNLMGISLMLQYKNGTYWAAFGVYRPGPSAKWSFAGAISKTPLIVDEPSDGAPWSACGPIEWPGLGRVRIALVSGAFGQPGAKYRLTADVCSYFDLLAPSGSDKYPDIFVDIKIKDVMGAIPIGYGPAAFLPNWLTTEEQTDINTNYGSSTQAYLSAKAPQMTNQGSYYYSSPVLEVKNYTVIEWTDGEPFIQQQETGNCGFLWMDSVVQTFGELNNLPKGATVSWYWFAIPQLTNTQSLAVTSLWYSNVVDMEPFKSASLYSSTTPGVAEKFWDMNDIEILCVTEKEEYTVVLSGGTDAINLMLTAVEGNQILGPAIEGLFKVTGTIGSTEIGADCYAWGEISLKSTQTRMASKGAHLAALI